MNDKNKKAYIYFIGAIVLLLASIYIFSGIYSSPDPEVREIGRNISGAREFNQSAIERIGDIRRDLTDAEDRSARIEEHNSQLTEQNRFNRAGLEEIQRLAIEGRELVRGIREEASKGNP